MSTRELKIRAEEPAREVDGALRSPYRGRDTGKSNGSVHQYLDAVGQSRRERVRSNVCRRRIQGPLPADPPQATAMMSAHRALNRVSEHGVDASERVRETRR